LKVRSRLTTLRKTKPAFKNEKFCVVAPAYGRPRIHIDLRVESFFGTMKSELGDPIWESRAIARAAIFDYIAMWYNRKRRHSTLGNLSPEQFEWLLPIAA
jgi:transposase InsO family protein